MSIPFSEQVVECLSWTCQENTYIPEVRRVKTLSGPVDEEGIYGDTICHEVTIRRPCRRTVHIGPRRLVVVCDQKHPLVAVELGSPTSSAGPLPPQADNIQSYLAHASRNKKLQVTSTSAMFNSSSSLQGGNSSFRTAGSSVSASSSPSAISLYCSSASSSSLTAFLISSALMVRRL